MLFVSKPICLHASGLRSARPIVPDALVLLVSPPLRYRMYLIPLSHQSMSNTVQEKRDKKQAAFIFLYNASYITLIKIHVFEKYQS
jgi:hypothetical protein